MMNSTPEMKKNYKLNWRSQSDIQKNDLYSSMYVAKSLHLTVNLNIQRKASILFHFQLYLLIEKVDKSVANKFF